MASYDDVLYDECRCRQCNHVWPVEVARRAGRSGEPYAPPNRGQALRHSKKQPLEPEMTLSGDDQGETADRPALTDDGTKHPIEETEGFEARLDAALLPPVAELVTAYFDPEKPFAGDTFDVLGVNDPMRITVDDLLAVTLLDVRVRPLALRALLNQESEAVAELLAAVPVDVPLWESTDVHLDAATSVWDLFCSLPGIDWVTAGKLLARKRPMLIPVFDSVIQEVLKPPPHRFWATLRAALCDQQRRAAIEVLRPPDLTPRVSTLRLLDVAVWMRHSDGTNARREQCRVGLTVAPRAPREDRL